MNGVGQDSDLVRELLEENNALENIQALRKRLLREKGLIDSQLQAGIQSQTQILAKGMSSLRTAGENIGDAQLTLAHMDKTYSDSTEHVHDFGQIQQISTMLANFDLTRKFVDHFQSFHRQISVVESLMDEDGEFDIDRPMQNLVPTHYLLSQLRQMREEAMTYLKGKDATSDTRLTVRKLYEPLDALSQRFDATIMSIAEDLLEILRVGNRSLIVRTAKIIEMEERQDLVASFNSKSNGGATGREPRRYLEHFFKSIEASIKVQFDNCMSTFPPDTQPTQLLEGLGFVNSELIGAKEDLEPCCPARWQIFNKYVFWYHQGVHRTLETIMRFEPPAQTLLDLLRYVKEYYGTMAKVFGVSRKKTPELLDPPLLDGRERDLYDDYLKMLVAKLKEWYNNIWTGEKRAFSQGTLHPERHPDGVGLETHTTVSKLITQQLEVAAESGQARVIAGCVDACCDVLTMRQKDWIKLMEEMTKKEISGDSDSPQGLYEYIFVIANDQDRAYAFLEQLNAKWSEPMPPRYQGRVIERFEAAQEGYQDVTKECFLCNLQIIYSDTQPAFMEVFKSDKWYKGVTIKAIIDTYVDFVEDAKKLLMKDLFEIFFGKLCTETILWYLRSLIVSPKSKPKKLNMPRGKERIMADAKLLYDFFTREDYGLDADVIRKTFYVFDLFCDVQDAPFEEIPALFQELRTNEKDAPLDLFEAMLTLRKDIDQKTLREIMADVRSVTVKAEPQVVTEEEEDQGHSFLYDFNKAKQIILPNE